LTERLSERLPGLRRGTLRSIPLLATAPSSQEFSLYFDKPGEHKKLPKARQSRQPAEDRYEVDPPFPPEVTYFLKLPAFYTHWILRRGIKIH
jgi:hypothetical protein